MAARTSTRGAWLAIVAVAGMARLASPAAAQVPDDPYAEEPESTPSVADDPTSEPTPETTRDADEPIAEPEPDAPTPPVETAAPEAEATPDAEGSAEPAPASGLPKSIFYGGVALTALTAAVGGYFGVQALSLASEERARDPRVPADVAGIAERALIADVFYGTALALAAATVVVAFFTDFSDPPPDATASSPEPTARVVPFASPSSAGLAAEVRW